MDQIFKKTLSQLMNQLKNSGHTTEAPTNDVPASKSQSKRKKKQEKKHQLPSGGVSNKLSNWAPCHLVYNGATYNCVEQAYI